MCLNDNYIVGQTGLVQIISNLEGEDDNPDDDEAAPDAGDDTGHLEGDQALDCECQDELDTPEAGDQVGGDQLQRPGQGREGEEAGHRQSWRLSIDTLRHSQH